MSLSVFHQSNYEVVRYYMLTFNEWHPTKNKELTPEGFTHGSEKEVWWLRTKLQVNVWRCGNQTY